MAAVPIKFRCHHCQQLLGVSRNRAGGVVACPRCAAELMVPDPDEPGVMTPEPQPPFPAPADSSEPLDSGIPLDLLNLRPEDIRVEPGSAFAAPFRLPEASPPSPRLAPSPDPVPFPSSVPTPVATGPSTTPTPAADGPPAATPLASGFGVNDLMAGTPIDVDTGRRPSPMRTVRPPARPSDLVLPRSVVAAWSLFVLLALALAFAAGLLAGHYVWRVH